MSSNPNKSNYDSMGDDEFRQCVREFVESHYPDIPRYASDVLIENFKVGNLARFGLDYASLSKLNPGLVFCSITGFGQTGPMSHLPGYDPIFQAMSGLMSVTGMLENTPGPGLC